MRTTAGVDHRYLVVGAGPAGLQLGYFLKRAGADHLVVERAPRPGTFFERYPRHRRLISLNKVHTRDDDPEIRLRWDWNSLLNDDPALLFPRYSREYLPHAGDLLRYLADFQRAHRLNVRYGCGVDRVDKVDGGFRVTLEGGAELRAECVVVATGWGGPYVPPIDGIEHAIGYEDVPEDCAGFADQRVLIVGKGNSAFETAERLLDHAAMVHLASPRPIRLAWNTKHPGDVRGMYGRLLDGYQFKTLHSVLDCVIERIWRDGDAYRALITYTHAEGEQEELEYDAVLRCTGFRMDTSLFGDGCAPRMAEVAGGRIPAVREDWQSVNVDGLYFAGTMMQARDFKRASSAFIDGFRYNIRTLTRLLRERYEGVPLEHAAVPADPDLLTGVMLDRVNWSSALWTQFEYLVDAFVRDPGSGAFRHYEDLPEDYAVARFGDHDLLTLGLRWGRDVHPDVFAIERHPRPERAAESAFIHPVVRRYRGGERVAERHLLEDLLARWRRPDRHVAPLRAFLAEQIG